MTQFFEGHDKPPIEEVLEHHGIKGQKWGVRREDPSGSSDSPSKMSLDEHEATKAYMAIKEPTKSKAEATKALAENEQKFFDKFNPSKKEVTPAEQESRNVAAQKHLDRADKLQKQIDEAQQKRDNSRNPYMRSVYKDQINTLSKQKELELKNAENRRQGKLTEEQKQLLVGAAVGAAVIGGLYLASRKNSASLAELEKLAGQPVSYDQFKKGCTISKMRTWGFGGYVQPSSYLREEFTLPAGHTFHRLSTFPENEFSGHTYSTHSIEDFDRYVSVFRHEKSSTAKLHHITFSTTKDLKVPTLTTTLETLRESLSKEAGHDVSREEALSTYKAWSGGSWQGKSVSNFFESMRAKGYGALVDEMDAGVIGETPLVVFAEHLSQKVSNPIGSAEFRKAEESLIEIRNRKG